jgi:hypothetical protein
MGPWTTACCPVAIPPAPRSWPTRWGRPKLAALLGKRADELSAGRVACDLRRLPLRGLIERIPHTHRYRLTEQGIQSAAFWTRSYNRWLRPGLAELSEPVCESPPFRDKLVVLTEAIAPAVAAVGVHPIAPCPSRLVTFALNS